VDWNWKSKIRLNGNLVDYAWWCKIRRSVRGEDSVTSDNLLHAVIVEHFF